MMSLICVQKQLSESDGNCKTILENGGRNPPGVTLGDIAENLLSFFDGVKSLHKAKKVIEKKYDIKKEHDDCWPADDIKRAWGQTQSMHIKSSRRRYWAHVIILQMIKRFMVYDECKQNAAQGDHDDTTNDINQSCETTRMKGNSEDASSESNDERQMWRAGLHAPKHKLTKQSSAASESQLSASSTDVAPSPAELGGKISYTHSSSNESLNSASANENEDTSDNNCEPRKSIDSHEELTFTDTSEQMKAESENGRGEDGLWSNQACGKAESMKGNPEDRSTQSKAELEIVEAAGEDKQSSGANRKSTKSGPSQAGSASQDRSRTQLQDTRNNASSGRSGPRVSAASEQKAAVKKLTVDETIYIRIPLSVMFGSGPGVTEDGVPPVSSPYKLIDGAPSNTNIRKRKSYAMSFDNETNNAKWVYEILNSDSIKDNCVQPGTFGQGYDRGHLAAARNHRWCREAKNDTYLFSNIIPQNSTLNRGMWRNLEDECRDMTEDQQISNVHVYTGPLYKSRTSVLGKIVPKRFFKVIIVEKKDGTVEKPKCYVIPNKEPKQVLKKYEKEIEYIEHVSGLHFIEHRVKSTERDQTNTVTLQGEHRNGEPCSVDIKVRISS